MGMFKDIPQVRTRIYLDIHGRSMTQVWVDDTLAKVVNTHPSQIRPDRITCLWTTDKSKSPVEDAVFVNNKPSVYR